MTTRTDGWITPTSPGPTRRIALQLVAIVAGLLLVWVLLGAGVLHEATTGGGDVTQLKLVLDDDGRVTGGPAVDGTAEQRSVRERDSARFAVSQRELTAPKGGTLTITIETPAGVSESAPTIRVHSPGNLVKLRRTKAGDVPSATISDIEEGDRFTVVVTAPARVLRGLSDVDATGPLDQVTEPLDAKVADNRADQERQRMLRNRAWLIAVVTLLLTVGAPLVWWRRTRRGFFRTGDIPRVDAGGVVGPPSAPVHAIDAAMLTAGTRRVDAADAFAGHVLDLVRRDMVRLMRTLDPREGSGVRFGIAAARAQAEERPDGDGARPGHPLDLPALELLGAMSDDGGSSAVFADSTQRLSTRLGDARVAPAQTTWASAVREHAREVGFVQEPPFRRLAITIVMLGAIALTTLVLLIAHHAWPGAVATWSLAFVGTLSLGVVFGAWYRDTRRWRRVAPLRAPIRARWLAWRHVLTTGEEPPTDLRSAPYAVAIGHARRGVPELAARDAVGLAAATPATVDALRRLAGAT